MDEQRLAIAIGDGQTIYAVPEPEDQRQLAEIFGDGPTIELTASDDDDVEGHAVSGDVLVDVEGHALTLRLPNAGDAAALRKALAVGVVSATIVGAGAIAALQNPTQAPTNIPQAPAAYSQQVPAQALHAEQAEAAREQRFADAQAATQAVNVPAPALHAEQAEAAREQRFNKDGK